jgi:hypothetical protein
LPLLIPQSLWPVYSLGPTICALLVLQAHWLVFASDQEGDLAVKVNIAKLHIGSGKYRHVSPFRVFVHLLYLDNIALNSDERQWIVVVGPLGSPEVS